MASKRRRRIKREEQEKLHGRLANIRHRRRGRDSLGSEIVKGQIEKASAGAPQGAFPMPGVPQAGQMPGMPSMPGQEQQQPDATSRQPGPEPLDPNRALQTRQKLDAKGLPPAGVQSIIQGDTTGVWNLPGIRAAYYGAKEKSRRLRSAIDTLRSGGVEGLQRMLGPTGGGANATSGNQVTPDQSSFLGDEAAQQQTPGGMISNQVSQVMGGPGLPGPGQSMGDTIQQAGGVSAAPVPMMSGKAAAFKAGFWRKMAELGKLPSELDEELTKKADMLDNVKAVGSASSWMARNAAKAYAVGGLALPFGVGMGAGLLGTRAMEPNFEDIEGLRDATKLRELQFRTRGIRTKTQKRLDKIKSDREASGSRGQSRLQRLQHRRDPGAEVDSIIQSVGA